MKPAQDALDVVLAEVVKARQQIGKEKTPQVSAATELDHIKALVYSWSRTHRPVISSRLGQAELEAIDAAYSDLLALTGKRALRGKYKTVLKELRSILLKAQRSLLLAPATIAPGNDTPPDFTPLAKDMLMQDILRRRWEECQRCIRAEAHLAATVMMGGLLEAMFVARANKMIDRSPLFKAKAAPLDHKTKKALPWKDWTLGPYIDVGYELRWITSSGKDVAQVLREYRNYVHPEKEKSNGVILSQFDSGMFWELTKALTRQLLASAGP